MGNSSNKKKKSIYIVNKMAKRNYDLKEYYEAGIELKGTEVKSIISGKVNIQDAYCVVRNNEIYILNMHISNYEYGNRNNVEPTRTRKLLLHKSEILKIGQKIKEKKLSLIPTKLYMKNNKIKLEIALGKGKKIYDKRQDIIAKDTKRKIEKQIKDSLR